MDLDIHNVAVQNDFVCIYDSNTYRPASTARISRFENPKMQPNNRAQAVTDDDYDAVISSYQRGEDAGALFDTFYSLFFSKSPDVPRKFADTNMQ